MRRIGSGVRKIVVVLGGLTVVFEGLAVLLRGLGWCAKDWQWCWEDCGSVIRLVVLLDGI